MGYGVVQLGLRYAELAIWKYDKREAKGWSVV